MASGEELLIADSSERDREGLRKLFDGEGYVCTVCLDAAGAKDLVQRKFFPVAVIDLDFGGTNGGLELARFIQKESPPTKVVLLAGRRSFESVVDALRLGVIDIVSKRPDQLRRLAESVRLALDRYRAGDADSSLLREVKSVLDEAFKIMLSLVRKVYANSASGVSSPSIKPAILVIDEDQGFLQTLAGLMAEKPWDVSVELSGGSGLDKASTFSFQIVVVRDQLMDLPGQMLIKSVQGQQSKTLGVLYSTVGEGHVDRYEGGICTQSDTPFRGPDHVIERISALVDELSSMQEERRYLQAFRAEHGTFLKRFADLKVRIDSLAK